MSKFNALIAATLAQPAIGSGLTGGRVQMVRSGDTIDFRDHSMDNLPKYTRQPGSNITPGRPNFTRLAGLGLGIKTLAPTAAPIPTGLLSIRATTPSGGNSGGGASTGLMLDKGYVQVNTPVITTPASGPSKLLIAGGVVIAGALVWYFKR